MGPMSGSFELQTTCMTSGLGLPAASVIAWSMVVDLGLVVSLLTTAKLTRKRSGEWEWEVGETMGMRGGMDQGCAEVPLLPWYVPVGKS